MISQVELPYSFQLENTTVWSFPKRGSWATHGNTAKYRGNFAPQVPRNLILRYSEEGETVLDPFVGSGTTLVECKLLNRRGIGIDINPRAVKLCKSNLDFEGDGAKQTVKQGDARDLDFVQDGSIDLVIAHPPYADAIKYSKDVRGDLSQIGEVEGFFGEMGKVADELYRALKPGRICAVLMGDTRRNRNVVPLGFWTFETFLRSGFKPKEIVIKVQHDCKTTPKWVKKAGELGFLLLKHEYLLIFRKPSAG